MEIMKGVPLEGAEQKENKEELIGKAFEAFQQALNKYPYGKTKKIVSDYILGKISPNDLDEEIKKVEKEEKIDEELRQEFEKIGVFQYKENLPVVDLDRIKNLFKENYPENFDPKIRDKVSKRIAVKTGSKSVLAALDRAFGNLPVISREDYDRGEKKTKPLFYTPKTRKEALDVEKIKNSDFYTLRSYVSARSNYFFMEDFRYFAEPISYREVELAAVLYHPRYGDGYRDESGRLFIKDPQDDKHKGVSTDMLRKFNLGNVTTKVGGRANASHLTPKVYIKEFLPNLVEGGLITPDDFRITTRVARNLGFRAGRENIPANGQIFFGGIHYYLGREFAGKKVVELTDGLGGIVEADQKASKEKLIYTFKVFKLKEVKRKVKYGKRRGGESKLRGYVGGKKEIELTPYSPEEYHPPKRADETEEEWQKRVQATENFARLLDFSNGLPQDIKKEFNDLPFDEQRIVSSAFKNIDKAKQDWFVKKFGLTGLRTMIGADYSSDFAKKSIKIAEKLPLHEANSIFENYREITDLAYEFEKIGKVIKENSKNLPEELRQTLPYELKEAILRKSTDLISAAYLISEKPGKSELKTKDIVFALRGLKTFLEIVESLRDGRKHDLSLVKKENNIFTFDVLDKEAGYEYKFKILLRPEEHPHEGAARINFALDFNTDNPDEELKRAFKQETLYKKNNRTKKESLLRIGIDREIREGKAEISLDVGRNEYDGDTFTRTGDVLGNALTLVTKEGHHNPKSIDQRFAKAEIFQELVLAFDKYLEEEFKT